MNWRVYTVRVVLLLFGFVFWGFFKSLVNKFEFLKSACFVVAGFGLGFFFCLFSPPLLPSKGGFIYI